MMIIINVAAAFIAVGTTTIIVGGGAGSVVGARVQPWARPLSDMMRSINSLASPIPPHIHAHSTCKHNPGSTRAANNGEGRGGEGRGRRRRSKVIS